MEGSVPLDSARFDKPHLIAAEDALSTAPPSENTARSGQSLASSARSGASLCTSKPLEVPACFHWQKNASKQDEAEVMVDTILQSFIDNMQRGAEMKVLLDDGNLLDVETSFDADMTRVILRVKEVTREMLFEDIERVSGPDEKEDSCHTNSEHLDDRCATLVLSTTHFLTFSFETKQLREYFQSCMKRILETHHAEDRHRIA